MPRLTTQQQAWLAALLLVLGVLGIYAGTFVDVPWSGTDSTVDGGASHDPVSGTGRSGYGFVNFDDGDYVYENPHVTAGPTAENVRWAFKSTDYEANWHPLTWLSHMLDVRLFGMDAGKHHLTNVLLHALSALLLYLFLRSATGHTWPSFFAAALFAWHPLRVEAVGWISERKEVLAGTFWMLTLLAYARYARRPGGFRYALVVLAFALGLMAKPVLVTLPFVLLLLDLWPLKRWRPRWRLVSKEAPFAVRPPGKLVAEKLPLLALVAASAILTLHAQGSGGATELLSVPLFLRLENAAVTIGTYLAQMFWPFGFAVFYPHPMIVYPNPEDALRTRAIVTLIAAAALTLCLCWPLVRSGIGSPLVGWLWYLGTLVPMLGIVQVGTQAHADRYTYIPLIGIGIGMAFGLDRLLRRSPTTRPAVFSVALFGLLGFLALSARQVTFWKDSETLWNHTLAVTNRNYKAHNNLGRILADRGELDRAGTQFEEALNIRPGRAPDPEAATANFNLAGIHMMRGELQLATGRVQRAIELEKATTIGLSAGNPAGMALIAWVLATSKDASLRDGATALELAKQCCQLTSFKEPFFLEALAAAHAELGNWEKAVKWQGDALSLTPPDRAGEVKERLARYRGQRTVYVP